MPILDKWTLDFISSNVAQTERLGVRLGELLQAHDLICLSGELGAGKTALARGVGRGWGTALRVTSPTFTLVNEYPRVHDGLILYHIDCYRLETAVDIETTGIAEILDSRGAVMIEWPEHITPLLSKDALWITLTYLNETRRTLRVVAKGERSAELLEQFKRSAFGV
ncbi:MAG: tRNA (adenosine(37)-N6)-threonylcarbamoyltransferase complex ATPase subunit type 1 TsaE [Ardenticatenaceae bacterium]|nr:tRNA (adenosine(37)-N6)-threonylcarbamoyltransferase complex ATPase subunit type 1 TsaE [Ardenticatenaceae bacterium]MCB8989736.1 tRNA (adenosine(37)-N6)-threonylcarbamoyltransferase complex ATPase subunit type 1 TsaE [Ardenticatenaceae bacterium]MCB9002805.1 tRNA (adenosine(37)-N6)-threonylcarbamoyltransferase complex ATPase subunit type 1 TsaE [Ardenticatenaceae bacterium]